MPQEQNTVLLTMTYPPGQRFFVVLLFETVPPASNFNLIHLQVFVANHRLKSVSPTTPPSPLTRLLSPTCSKEQLATVFRFSI